MFNLKTKANNLGSFNGKWSIHGTEKRLYIKSIVWLYSNTKSLKWRIYLFAEVIYAFTNGKQFPLSFAVVTI